MQTYFKHSIIFSGKQEDVDTELNYWYNSDTVNVISITVTPERVGDLECDGFKFPKYIYHICIVYS